MTIHPLVPPARDDLDTATRIVLDAIGEVRGDDVIDQIQARRCSAPVPPVRDTIRVVVDFSGAGCSYALRARLDEHPAVISHIVVGATYVVHVLPDAPATAAATGRRR